MGREGGHSRESVGQGESGQGEIGQGAFGQADVPEAGARAVPPASGNPAEEARRRRLAAALRENLKRRKDQSRQKRDLQKPGPGV